MNYTIYYCAYNLCDNYRGRWPVADDDPEREKRCSDCGRPGMVSRRPPQGSQTRDIALKGPKRGKRRVNE